jgi:hypothetical protein
MPSSFAIFARLADILASSLAISCSGSMPGNITLDWRLCQRTIIKRVRVGASQVNEWNRDLGIANLPRAAGRASCSILGSDSCIPQTPDVSYDHIGCKCISRPREQPSVGTQGPPRNRGIALCFPTRSSFGVGSACGRQLFIKTLECGADG